MRTSRCGCVAHGLRRSDHRCPECKAAGCGGEYAAVGCPGIRAPKRQKYGAKRTTVGGRSFHSKGEAARGLSLALAEKAGEITDLQYQVPFDLTVNGVLVCRYIPDFCYNRDGKHVVEDWKGMRTTEYRIKAKLMKAIYGIDILETGARDVKRAR